MIENLRAFEGEYAIWNERSLLADCLVDLGLNELAQEIHNTPTTVGVISYYLDIVIKRAEKVKHHDILERLYFAGLIYG